MKHSTPRPCPFTATGPRRLLARAVLALSLGGLLCQPDQANSGQLPLPCYEPFPASYTNDGSVITVNGVDWVARPLYDPAAPQYAVWSWGNAGTGDQMITGAAALSYAGLWQASGTVGLFTRSNHVTGNRNSGIAFETVNTNKLYTSFLINVQTWPNSKNRLLCDWNTQTNATGGSDRVSLYLSKTNATTGVSNRVYLLKRVGSTSGPGVEPPDNAPILTAGTTHLVVMRYTFNDGLTNDEVAIWVDPGSLGAAEADVPSPAVTYTTNTDIPSFASFCSYLQNDTDMSGSSAFLDEIWIGRTWAEVTPTSQPCYTASVRSGPFDKSVVEGGMATFTIIAGGFSPTYQWQVSTDGGGTWAPLTQGLGTNTPTLTIPVATMAQQGNKYRCHIAVACDGSTDTSPAATLTVTPPVVTPTGVVVDDFFKRRDRLIGPVNSTNSQWYTDVSSSLYENPAPDPFMLVGKPQDATSCMWLGYFVSNTAPPVHLDVGRVLQATLVLSCQGIQIGVSNGLRLGLYDHYDAGVRLAGDGSAVKNSGSNVRGYMFAQDWETAFGSDQPQILYARNNLLNPNLMGATGDYVTLAHSAEGFLGAPAFSDGTTYTLDLYVARMTTNRCSVALSVSGGGTNYTTAAADRDYGYHRFDCIGVRPTSQQATAIEFDISEFKVQVLQMPPPPTLTITRSGQDVVLTWTNPAAYMPFQLQQASELTGAWTIVPGGDTSPYTVPTTNSATFFRLEWP